MSLLLALGGCGDDDGTVDVGPRTDTGMDAGDGTDTGLDTGPETDTGPELDGGGDTGPEVDAGMDASMMMAAWTLTEHPCVGNRTDALWRDADGTLYVGCGSTTTGLGLFVSSDDGATWAAPTTTPINFFATWRVHDVWRDGSGLLYVSGRNTANSQRVVSADTSGASWTLEIVYTAGSTVGTSFEVATFRRTPSGRAFIHSTTGSDMLMRADDDAEWVDADWATPRKQLLDMEILGERVFGAGSRIVEPPYLFLEDEEAGTFTMDTFELAMGIGAYDGEMWSLDVDASGVVVGGVDQAGSASAGYIYVVDPAGPTVTQEYNVRALIPDDATWIRGVCRDGADIVAVGERSARNLGLVLFSSDSGATWTDETPDTGNPAQPYRPAHECLIADGDVYVVGSGGSVAIRSL